MTKPWIGTGLSDYFSWLGETHKNDGLVYRGDADFEQLGPRGMLTLLEFKNAGEPIGRGQLNWLRRRARDERTEVRVVRELVGTDPKDPARQVTVWDPLTPWTAQRQVSLTEVVEFVNSRAYRSARPEDRTPTLQGL